MSFQQILLVSFGILALSISTGQAAGSEKRGPGETQEAPPSHRAKIDDIHGLAVSEKQGCQFAKQEIYSQYIGAFEKIQTINWKVQADERLDISEDSEQAVTLLVLLSQEGYQEATGALCSFYYNFATAHHKGWGVSQDLNNANVLYEKIIGLVAKCRRKEDIILSDDALCQVPVGEKTAQKARYVLGCWYLEDEGVTEDQKKGIELLTAAANDGHAEAQYKLGQYYSKSKGKGRGSKKMDIAVKWFSLAADQGHLMAKYNMAFVYKDGLGGFPKDVDKARQLFSEGVAQGIEIFKTALTALERRESKGH